MNQAEATELMAEINRTPGLQTTGQRRYGRDSYAVDVVDTVTGYPFVVNTREAWQERQREVQAMRDDRIAAFEAEQDYELGDDIADDDLT